MNDLGPHTMREFVARLNNRALEQIRGGRLKEARRNLRRAVRVCGSGHARLLAELLCTFGLLASDEGKLSESRAHFEQAGRLFRRLRDRRGRARVLLNLAILDKDEGAMSEARARCEAALPDLSPEVEPVQRAHALNVLGLTHLHFGEHQPARDRFLEALALYRAGADRENEALTLHNLGSVHERNDELSVAFDLYRQALAINREIDAKLGQADDLLAMAGLNQLACPQQAARLHLEALRLFTESGHPRGRIGCLTNLGILCREQKNYREAEHHLTAALTLARGLGDPHLVYDVHLNRGDVRCLDDRLQSAARDYASAATAASSVRARLLLEEEAHGYFETGHLEACDRLVWLYSTRLRDGVRAFEWMEKTRSQELIRRLRLGRWPGPRRVPRILARREKAALERLSAIMSGEERHQPAEQSSAALRFQEEERRLQALWAEIGQFDAEYAAQRNGHAPSLSRVRGALRLAVPAMTSQMKGRPRRLPSEKGERPGARPVPGRALLEYYVAGDQTFLFVVRPDRAGPPAVETIGLGASHWERCRQELYGNLSGVNPYNTRGFDRAIRPFYELGSILLGPALEHLEGIDRLYIVPHQQLHYLPFHGMKIPTPEGECFAVERFEITYLPAASLLRFCQQKNPYRQGRAGLSRPLVMGTWASDDKMSFQSAVRAEVSEVAALLGGLPPHVGTAASKARYLQESPCADLIHLACHGFFEASADVMAASGLLLNDGLSLPPRKSDSDHPPEAFLSARDLVRQQLDCHLVTLSACSTGESRLRAGDELVGLSRALFYAGAPSVLLTLWMVHAESKRPLVRAFYRHWLADRAAGKAAALRRAQRELIGSQEHGSLYHWGAYCLMGDYL